MAIIDPITALVCLMLTALLVIGLNLVSLIILAKSKKRNKLTDHPSLWLLMANILIGLFPLPIYALKKSEFLSIQATGHLCDAWRYTYFTTIHLAMASLIVMTFEKIIRLTHPFRSERLITKCRINIVLSILWLFFLVFDMIPFFPIEEQDDEYCHYVVKKKWAVAMNIITMVIPVPIIISTYVYMILLAYKQALSIRSTSTLGGRKHSVIDNVKLAVELKATRTVLYIVGSYLICWLPSTLYYLLEWLCPSCYPENYEPHKTWIRFFFKLLVMFHALVTPVLFCWQRTDFRTDAKQAFRKFMQSPTLNFRQSNTLFTISKSQQPKTKRMENDLSQGSGTGRIFINPSEISHPNLQVTKTAEIEGSSYLNNTFVAS